MFFLKKQKQKKNKKKTKTESKKLNANLAVWLSLSETIYVNILLVLKQIANMYYGSKCRNLSLMRTRTLCLELSITRRQVPIIMLMILRIGRERETIQKFDISG